MHVQRRNALTDFTKKIEHNGLNLTHTWTFSAAIEKNNLKKGREIDSFA